MLIVLCITLYNVYMFPYICNICVDQLAHAVNYCFCHRSYVRVDLEKYCAEWLAWEREGGVEEGGGQRERVREGERKGREREGGGEGELQLVFITQ